MQIVQGQCAGPCTGRGKDFASLGSSGRLRLGHPGEISPLKLYDQDYSVKILRKIYNKRLLILVKNIKMNHIQRVTQPDF